MEENARSSCKMQVAAALLANIPTVIYGIQIGWLSPMTPILQSTESTANPLSDTMITWLAAVLPLGALISVPLFSFTSDYMGRKYSIIFLSLISVISWILKIFAVNPPGLICARAFAGVASSGCFLVVPVYVKEISQDSLRGALGSLLMTACNFGVILVYILGMLLPYGTNQWIYLSISLTHVIMFSFMPESPSFLIKMQKDEKASTAIAWLRSLNKDEKAVQDEINKLKVEETLFRRAPKVTVKNILQDKVICRPLIVCLVLIGVQTLSGCFAIVNYAASIFVRAGSIWSPNLLALFVGALQLAGSLLAVVSVEKFGRKMLLIISSFVISSCMAAVATSFLLGLSWVPVLAVCLSIFCYGAGLGPVPFVVMAEVFTFHLRARLVGVIMLLSWLNSTLTVLMFAPIANAFGEQAVFYTFAAITLFGTVYTVFCVPETRGRSLEEIQNEFLGKNVD